MRKGHLYDFEGFRVDSEQRCLMREGEMVSLTPKAFDTLLVLVENRGRIISKDALLDEVWKDTFVEESTLAQNISTLRKAFAQFEGAPDFIVTIPRRGYKFVADVSEIVDDEEVLVVEKRSVTHIVAEQEQIHSGTTFSLLRFMRRFWVGVSAVIALAVIVAIASYFYLYSSSTQFQSKFQQFNMATLFSGEEITQTAISPDGKYVAVVENRSGGDVLLLRQIADGNSVSLAQEKDLSVSGIVFSPASDSVYYSAYKKSDPFPKYGNLYHVPLLGGASRLVNKDVDGPISFSPDNKRFAFVRGVIESRESVLMTANLDGSGERKVASRSLMDGFSTNGLSWSPDGKSIAVTVYDRGDHKRPMKLLAVDVESGKSNVLSDRNWMWIGRAAWLKDGSGIVVVAYADETPNLTDEVWFVSYPDGESRTVTRGLSGINGVGVTDDGNTLVAGKNNRLTTRSFIELEDPKTSHVIAKTVSEDNMTSLGARWVGENQIVFAKTQNGSADVWSMNTDGSNQRQLTSEPGADFDPIISPDGKSIYFRSNRNGGMSMWRMNIDGSGQTEVINTMHASKPAIPADGSVMYYSAQPDDKRHTVLWKSSRDGKERKQITNFRSFNPLVSPDGKYLLCFAVKDGSTEYDPTLPIMLTLFSTAENKIVRQFEPLQGKGFPLNEWKRDSSGFYQIENSVGKSELREMNLEGDVVDTIWQWSEGKVFQIALSDDGKRLFIEKGEDVVSVLKFTNG